MYAEKRGEMSRAVDSRRLHHFFRDRVVKTHLYQKVKPRKRMRSRYAHHNEIVVSADRVVYFESGREVADDGENYDEEVYGEKE